MPRPSPINRPHKTKASINVRRERGEIACAECRRSKVKCTRTIPCALCARKGCQSVCPLGVIDISDEPRQEESTLSSLMEQMRGRIQQLEDALQISHSLTTTERHPLLSNELLQIKNNLRRERRVKKIGSPPNDDTVELNGTLWNWGQDVEAYVGFDKSMINLFGTTERMMYDRSRTCDSTIHSRAAFQFSPIYQSTEDLVAAIEAKLPSIERASALVEAYLENVAWVVMAADREEVIEELIPEVYKRRGNEGRPDVRRVDKHTLSLLLAIFACGAATDLTQQSANDEADLFCHLAWEVLIQTQVLDNTSLRAVQTLMLLIIFEVFSYQMNSFEAMWRLTSFCCVLAVDIGLHKDPSHFKFSPKLIQRRRLIFWELYDFDAWKAVTSGRPMIFHRSIVDCELPEDKQAITNEDGTKIPSYLGLCHEFSKTVASDIAAKLNATSPLKLSEVLTLGRKIRDFGLSQLAIKGSRDADAMRASYKLKLTVRKESMLLLLHCSVFARALADNPTNPAQGPFAPSFVMVYRSAISLLRTSRELFDGSQLLMTRYWPFWTGLIFGTVLLGSVAKCGTEAALAPQAYMEFIQSLDMLAKMQTHPLVKQLMPTLLQLAEEAHKALTKNGIPMPRYHPVPTVFTGSSYQQDIPRKDNANDPETSLPRTPAETSASATTVNDEARLMQIFMNGRPSATLAGEASTRPPGSNIPITGSRIELPQSFDFEALAPILPCRNHNVASSVCCDIGPSSVGVENSPSFPLDDLLAWDSFFENASLFGEDVAMVDTTGLNRDD